MKHTFVVSTSSSDSLSESHVALRLSDLNESTSLWWRFSYAIDRAVDLTPQANGGVCLMYCKTWKFNTVSRWDLNFTWKPRMGKTTGRREEEFTTFVCYNGGLQYIIFLFSFLLFSLLASFSGLALSISSWLCYNGWSGSFSVIHDLLLRFFHIY